MVNLTGTTDYIVNVHDSGAVGDGADTLTINGTTTSDVFLIRANFVARLASATSTDRNAFVERINYDRTMNTLAVNGGAGADEFYADDNSAITTLDGGAGEDLFQFGQMFGAERTAPAHVAFGDEITTVHTTAGWLSRGISFSTTAYGGDNDDRFQVYSNKAPLKLFGEDDNDEFVVRAFVLDTGELGTSDTLLSGGGGDDHIEYNINAPVSIDGGAGVDSVVVIGTEVNDNFAITEDGVQGAGLNVHYENVERLEVDGLEGDDNFFVLSTSPRVVTTIIGGLGSDTVNVAGDVTQRIVALSVEGVSGFINHTLTSTDPAYDGVFADGIHVSVANGSAGTVVVEPSGGDSTAIEDRPGANVDTYTMRLAAAAPTDGTVAYLTVSATPAPSKDRAADGKLLEVSLDNVHYVHALVLTFDSSAASGATAWARTQTIYVRAASDTASEGERVAVVSHSIESTNPAFDRRPIANVEVKVIDNDRAGLIVTQTGTTTQVVEGGASDTYTVSLTRSPDPGETVTVTVARDTTQVSTPVTVTFTDADWMTNKTVTVSAVNDTNVENRRITTLIHTVTSDGAVFGAVAEQPEVDVDVRDNDAGGLIVDESGGTTLVSDGHPDTYTIRLTKAPTADVTVGILTDGKTIVTSSDARFTAATATEPAKVRFADATGGSTSWSTPITITVSVNPTAIIDVGSQPVQTFPAQPHRTNQVFGPIIVEGGQIKDRALVQGIRLPTETDDPLPVRVTVGDESIQTDRLNVFNDGSLAPDTGTLGAISSDEAAALAKVYDRAISAAEFGQIGGLDMGGPLTLDYGTAGAHDFRTFSRGIAYHDIEIVDVLLGRNADTFTVDATTAGSITVVQGGGGSDHITVTGNSGGPTSPLVIFGDTSQDGFFYNSTAGSLTPTGNANGYPVGMYGDDVIDASANSRSVAIYGGRGNDTIIGSQAGDHLAGGSGDDTINGQGGDDHIYGDDGFNLDLSRRLSLSTQILLLVNDVTATSYQDFDDLAAGRDTLSGDDGNDILFGDHGVVDQPGKNRILTTAYADISVIRTVRDAVGADDTLNGNADNDILLGGFGADLMHGNAGNDTAFGDNATLTLIAGIVRTATTTADAIGGIDTMYGDGGQDILAGGAAADRIDGGDDKDLIFGDNVTLDRSTTLGNMTNPRFRQLAGATLYDTTAAGAALVTAAWQTDPTGAPVWTDYRITLLDMDASAAANSFGNDYIAGGPNNDQIFGERGDDTIQGDGSIAGLVATGLGVAASANLGVIRPSFDAMTDGDDYIEGNAGNDVIFGNLGQDDIVGGSSDLFSLTTAAKRQDGTDVIYGGSGTMVARNDAGLATADKHARDADAIAGDNADIFRIVTGAGSYAQFNYDQSSTYEARGTLRVVVRAFTLLDYSPRGDNNYLSNEQAKTGNASPQFAVLVTTDPLRNTNIGGADFIHGESGDDIIHGQTGNDALFGEGQDDDLYGESGFDWIAGGAGEDGALGDDGQLRTSRNGTAEPLYGVAATTQTTMTIGGDPFTYVLSASGQLLKTADLEPFLVGNNDVIYGGLGDDFLHGGAGDDSISGAEALPLYYQPNPLAVLALYYNVGDVLQHGYRSGAKFVDELRYYDENNPWAKVMVPVAGGGTVDFLLNFQARVTPTSANPVIDDGRDYIFGDVGHDWLVGGTNRDDIWGGYGDDLINADDDHDTTYPTLANNLTDARNATTGAPSYADFTYGGAGRDVLIGNTFVDRLIDWIGEFNTYVLPYSPFGEPTTRRRPAPDVDTLLIAMSKSDGSDPTRGNGGRNGEPNGEIGHIDQSDPDWGAQSTGPADPQNLKGAGTRDDGSIAEFGLTQTVAAPAQAASVARAHDLMVTAVATEAKAYWTATLGAGDARLARLDGVSFAIADLPGLELAETVLGSVVIVDADAAGYGWDAIDLAEVLEHELGHVLGLAHGDVDHAVMRATYAVSVDGVLRLSDAPTVSVRDAASTIALARSAGATTIAAGETASSSPVKIAAQALPSTNTAARAVEYSAVALMRDVALALRSLTVRLAFDIGPTVQGVDT